MKENTSQVVEWVDSQKHDSKVAIYSSLLVLLSPSKKKQAAPDFVELYDRINDELFKKENNSYQDMKSNQQKTQTETDNWVTWSSIQQA